MFLPVVHAETITLSLNAILTQAEIKGSIHVVVQFIYQSGINTNMTPKFVLNAVRIRSTTKMTGFFSSFPYLRNFPS